MDNWPYPNNPNHIKQRLFSCQILENDFGDLAEFTVLKSSEFGNYIFNGWSVCAFNTSITQKQTVTENLMRFPRFKLRCIEI